MTIPPTQSNPRAGAHRVTPGSRRSGADAVVRTEALTKRYPGDGKRPPAVDRLDLDIHAGEIFGLLGSNGAIYAGVAGFTALLLTAGIRGFRKQVLS